MEGKFGTMSEVVVLRGMVDGMDLEAEMEDSSQGGLMQEIGQECGEKVSFVVGEGSYEWNDNLNSTAEWRESSSSEANNLKL